jgi:phosphatidylserine decarboxylase
MSGTMTHPVRVKPRHGDWLPADERVLVAFRHGLAEHSRARGKQALTPVVQALYDTVEDEPLLRMHLTQSIRQALARNYDLGYVDIAGLMASIDAVMTYSPPFSTSELVGCPINALLDWPMCMPSGFAFFQFPQVNERLRAVLDHWGRFLSGPESRSYLNTTDPTGWFSPDAGKYVDMSLFVCEPDEPYYGYKSWNDFFTRRFKPGMRPVAGPADPGIVVSACEATPYQLQSKAKLLDTFWIKAQPYSLRDMFTENRSDLAERFVGGTVYQAFLNAYNFHRWHAPVSGTIVEAYNVPGTYYADAPSEGIDPAGPNNSQGFITAVATRAVIVIDTGVKGLGTVACIFVGMAEISSCVIGVRAGRAVTKGEELGCFQYGGSTHCVIFEPHIQVNFGPQPPFDHETPIVEINSKLATVTL